MERVSTLEGLVTTFKYGKCVRRLLYKRAFVTGNEEGTDNLEITIINKCNNLKKYLFTVI
jgi:hypothetical protein